MNVGELIKQLNRFDPTLPLIMAMGGMEGTVERVSQEFRVDKERPVVVLEKF